VLHSDVTPWQYVHSFRISYSVAICSFVQDFLEMPVEAIKSERNNRNECQTFRLALCTNHRAPDEQICSVCSLH
jgi:hypothetical protein